MRAYEARTAGHSWEAIALRENYPDGKAAQRDVGLWISQGRAMVSDYSRQQLVELELDRLDLMQAGLWTEATRGNVGAVGAALKIMDTRIRLLSLEPAGRAADQAGARHVTIVVPADDDGYRAALTRMVDTDG